MRQHCFGKRGNEWAVGNRWWRRSWFVREVVQLRRADAIAGEVERDQPMNGGIGGQVNGGEVIVFRRLIELQPVLAEQRALRRHLLLVPFRPTDAVRRGEQ